MSLAYGMTVGGEGPTGRSGSTTVTSRTLLLIIDLQAVVAPGGAWEIPGIEEVVGSITTLVDGHDGPALATRHCPVPDQPGSLGPFERHQDLSALTADASQLVPGIEHLQAADKQTYSAYRCDAVRDAASRAERVVVCGVETDCCVAATVFDLLDARVPTVVVPEAVIGPDHVAHDGVLRAMNRLGDLVQIRSLEDL